ncbi:hypothetical protein [Scatolibacter rhodanostii]|uniref:hypothetical protein n=1 Tax=Scatolibacter rhodanostii TaxID=2014781 RepID=UPI0013563862|nr:hypothetical protein [Scatolibacter rhodanostii]
MLDYKKMNSDLVIALSTIIDIAEAAIAKTEETILSDEDNSPPLYYLNPKD